MSTETITPPAAPATPAPGTPGTDTAVPKITPTAKEMTAKAFGEPAPTAPTKPTMPAKKPAQESAPKQEAVAHPDKVVEAPKVEPKVEPASPVLPEDALQIPANASPEAVKNFKQYKESMKGILAAERQRVIDAEAKLKTYSTAAPADAAEIERIKTEHKAAMDRLAILDLKNHPDFTRQYVEPKNKALATASEVLAYNGKEGVELVGLLGKSMKDFNAAVSEFTKDMNSADAATVAQSLREARTLHASEQAALSKSTELQAALKSKTALQQKQAFEEVAGTVTSALKRIEVTDTMDPEMKQAAAAYNQRLDNIRAAAEKRAFGPITERDVAAMAFESEQMALMRDHVIPGLEKRFAAQNAVIADLTAQLEAVKGVRSPSTPAGDGAQGETKKTRQQMLQEAYGRNG